LGALSESLDGFLEIRESAVSFALWRLIPVVEGLARAWQVLAFAVLAHDLISPSKFLEQEYSDYFCL
jgi:hypothetical protein